MRQNIAVALCFIFSYLIGAFVLFDLNAGNWSMDARFCIATIAIAWSVITVGYIQSQEKK